MQVIGIIGNGFVGKAIKESFKNHFEVFVFDKDKRKANVESLKELINKCKMVFLCLPTPMNPDRSCHLNIVEETLKKINKLCDEMDYYGNEQRTIIIKSTIEPGTTERWNEEYKFIQGDLGIKKRKILQRKSNYDITKNLNVGFLK